MFFIFLEVAQLYNDYALLFCCSRIHFDFLVRYKSDQDVQSSDSAGVFLVFSQPNDNNEIQLSGKI